MGTIISNGKTIYRYNNEILRTPLQKTLTLTPTEQACYDVGDTYVQSLPTRDFFVTNRGVYSIASGHDMRKSYLLKKLPQNGVQIWRKNNAYPNYESGYVFYNGNYSPAFGMTGGASFIRIPAYKFSLPTKYKDWSISNISLNTSDIGVVMSSGSAKEKQTDSRRYPVFAWDASTQILDSKSNWRDKKRYMNIGAFSASKLNSTDACNLYSQCQMSITVNYQNTGACDNTGNAFPLWETWPSGAVKYNDGYIPHAFNNPHIQTHSANTAFINACDTLRNDGFFIALIPAVSDSGGNDTTVNNTDYPCYYMQQNTTSYFKNWWLCERIVLQNIQVTIQFGE